MRSPQSSRSQTRRGQSAIEFLFVMMFFMMLVGFIRTFVFFELDIFNHTNITRWKTLKWIRSADDINGDKFADEENGEWKKSFVISKDDNTWKAHEDNYLMITSRELRPIPFLLPTNSTVRQTTLPPRKLV